MIALELINIAIPALPGSTTVQDALDSMEELHIPQLPIVEEGEFKGLVYENLLLDVLDTSQPLASFMQQGLNCYVYPHQHIFELLKVAADNRSSIAAVLDADTGKYLGCVPVADVMQTFVQGYSFSTPGAVLVLSMLERDYSLAQISRLVESDNFKILNTFVETDEDPGRIKVTLKVNNTSAGRLIATLERFNYQVVEKYSVSAFPDIDKERLEGLLNYLNV